jgi:hypothetical protein
MDIQAITSEAKQVLGGLSFPVHKDDIINHVKERGANGELKGLMEKLPAQKFGSVEEIMQKLPLGNIGEQIGKLL